MECLSLAFTGGWASGVNAYLVVLVLGITDRVNDVAEIPDVLARWEVLAAAGFMFAIEFVADKVTYIDSTWDAISTAIRPTVGAVIGGGGGPYLATWLTGVTGSTFIPAYILVLSGALGLAVLLLGVRRNITEAGHLFR